MIILNATIYLCTLQCFVVIFKIKKKLYYALQDMHAIFENYLRGRWSCLYKTDANRTRLAPVYLTKFFDGQREEENK